MAGPGEPAIVILLTFCWLSMPDVANSRQQGALRLDSGILELAPLEVRPGNFLTRDLSVTSQRNPVAVAFAVER